MVVLRINDVDEGCDIGSCKSAGGVTTVVGIVFLKIVTRDRLLTD